MKRVYGVLVDLALPDPSTPDLLVIEPLPPLRDIALQAGVTVRDRFPETFRAVHRDLFAARHDQGLKLNEDDVVRRSLDAVDHQRKRLVIGFAVAVVFLGLTFVNGGYTANTKSINLFTHAVMLMILAWVTVVGLGIVIQMNVMTKRILRAIELAARK